MDRDNLNNKPDKLTDKAFTRLMVTSVLGILVCIMCLCSATWAWFTGGVSSDQNKLKTGVFELVVTVETEQGAPAVRSAIQVSTDAKGISLCEIESEGTYTITLTMSENTTVSKGFCVIKSGDKSFKTASIRSDDTEAFTFTIEVSGEATVTFTPAWGIPAEHDVDRGGNLVIN